MNMAIHILSMLDHLEADIENHYFIRTCGKAANYILLLLLLYLLLFTFLYEYIYIFVSVVYNTNTHTRLYTCVCMNVLKLCNAILNSIAKNKLSK